MNLQNGAIRYDKSIKDKIAAKWSLCMSGYVMDLNPHLPSLQAYLSWKWSLRGNLELVSQGKGCFLLKFSDQGDFDYVLSLGIWLVSRRPMILNKWQPGDPMEVVKMSSVPV